MKKILLYSTMLITAAVMLYSCDKDELGPSVIQDSTATETAMDKWFIENFNKPYNIDVIYKLRDIDADAYDSDDGSSYGFNLVPADQAKSFALAQIIKYLWAGVFEDYLGADFIKENGFRQIQFEGTYRYKSASYTKATASKGVRIVFCGVNNVNMSKIKDGDFVSSEYMKTMYHENTHILNQKKAYPAEFANVNGADYIGDDWTTRGDTTVFQLGFISSYAGHSASEDFAEILSYYVTQYSYWNYVMNWKSPKIDNGGGQTDSAKLTEKLTIVRDYMKDAWGIDIDTLREIYEQKAASLGSLELITY
ncbi:MAG: putative zinc-binding metallopeptidase [Dysgonamonadaceae bacterium]|nr:putative zinc-binding metallopeptidase [Dysgonamonadaceae bacterium]